MGQLSKWNYQQKKLDQFGERKSQWKKKFQLRLNQPSRLSQPHHQLLKKRIRKLKKKRKLSLHQLNCQRKKAKRRKNRPKRKVLKTRNGTKNLKRKRVRTSKNVRRRRRQKRKRS